MMHINPSHAKRFLEESQEYQEFKKALAVLGDKWSALIIMCIFDGPTRFVDIQKFAVGISPRTLTQRLQMLEEEGLITRHEFKEFPPRTEYTLTQKALDLKAAMVEMKKWAHKYCHASHSGSKHSFFK